MEVCGGCNLRSLRLLPSTLMSRCWAPESLHQANEENEVLWARLNQAAKKQFATPQTVLKMNWSTSFTTTECLQNSHIVHLTPPIDHVLVDFENVCEIDTTIFAAKNVDFRLLLGAGQTKLDIGLVEKLLLHAASVQLVRLTSRGKNALDLTLAYYLGEALAADPTGIFHIVSKDKGFDPLIQHLQSKHHQVQRHDSFASVTFGGLPKSRQSDPSATLPMCVPAKTKTAPLSLDGLLDQAVAQLRKTAAHRPKSRISLLRYLITYLRPEVTETTAESIIEALASTGHLAIDGKGAVSYSLE